MSEVHVDACRWGARAEALEIARAHAHKAGARRLEASIVSQLAQALLYGSTPVDDAIARCEGFLAEAHDDRATESAMLATHMSQIVVVVAAGQTTEAALKDALGRLEGCGQVGLLLNKGRAAGPIYDGYQGYD